MHVDQAAAEVLDHLDPLRLAARERVGLAVEAEVVEPDVDHGPQPLDERADDRLGDGVGHQPEDRDQVADLHRRQLGDVVAVDLRAERRLAEPRALAQRARSAGAGTARPLLRPLRERLDVAPDVGPLELLDDAEVGGVHRPCRRSAACTCGPCRRGAGPSPRRSSRRASCRCRRSRTRRSRRSPSRPRTGPGSRPSLSDLERSRKSSATKPTFRPSPLHSGHMPCGSLNENAFE